MPDSFKMMPPSVKRAIVSLAVGWATHFVFYFGYIAEGQPERITYLQLGVGIGICYCVATLKRWARRLCLFFNFGMVVMYSWATVIFGWSVLGFAQVDKTTPLLLTAGAALAFGLSFYFLLTKEAALVFSPPKNEEDPGIEEPPAPEERNGKR